MFNKKNSTATVSNEVVEELLPVDCDLSAEDFEHVGQDKAKMQGISRPSINFWKDSFGRLKRDKSAMFFSIILLIIIAFSILGPIFSGHDGISQDTFNTDLPMFSSANGLFYIFGTDSLGRDFFTRVWDGGRVSLGIAFVAVIINCVIGVVYGGISGYFGGWLDNVLMRICEVINGIPYLLIIILLMTVMPKGIGTIVVAYSAVGWVGMARLVRGQILQLKEQEFVIAAQTLGASASRIILKHMIPNILSIIIVNLTLAIPSIIFTEAFLSFLGIGVPVPYSSWGTLCNEGIISFRYHPKDLLIPAFFISLTMLSFNLLGDKLRDAFDPKLRR